MRRLLLTHSRFEGARIIEEGTGRTIDVIAIDAFERREDSGKVARHAILAAVEQPWRGIDFYHLIQGEKPCELADELLVEMRPQQKRGGAALRYHADDRYDILRSNRVPEWSDTYRAHEA